MCCHPIYSGRQACGRASRGHIGGRSHRISPPSSAALAFIFIARRIQPFLSLIDREVEFVLHYLLGILGKIPVHVTAPRFEPTSQRQKVSRSPTEQPGLHTRSTVLCQKHTFCYYCVKRIRCAIYSYCCFKSVHFVPVSKAYIVFMCQKHTMCLLLCVKSIHRVTENLS